MAPPAATSAAAAADDGNDLLSRVVALVRSELGVPYRYGGITPRGFDCSGLVYYAFRKVGIDVPRTSNAQHADSVRVSLADLQPGDLVFFKIRGLIQLHVGVYVGDGEFIHAPRPGKRVSYARLNDRYWKARYVGAGRFS